MNIALFGNSYVSFNVLRRLCRSGYKIQSLILPPFPRFSELAEADFKSIAGEFNFAIIHHDLPDSTNLDKVDLLICPESKNIQLNKNTLPCRLLTSNLQGQYKNANLNDISAEIYAGRDQSQIQLLVQDIEGKAGVLCQKSIRISSFDDLRSCLLKSSEALFLMITSYVSPEGSTILSANSKNLKPHIVSCPRVSEIDWSKPTARIYDQIRSQTHPSDGARSCFDQSNVIIWRGHDFAAGDIIGNDLAPGIIAGIYDELGVAVKTGDGMFLITRIQQTGKPELPAWVWADSAKIKPGERFGELEIAEQIVSL